MEYLLSPDNTERCLGDGLYCTLTSEWILIFQTNIATHGYKSKLGALFTTVDSNRGYFEICTRFGHGGLVMTALYCQTKTEMDIDSEIILLLMSSRGLNYIPLSILSKNNPATLLNKKKKERIKKFTSVRSSQLSKHLLYKTKNINKRSK